MMDDDLKEIIDEGLARHEISPGEVPSKTWMVSRSERHVPYWFYVTWTPGHLFLSGDLSNMSLTHYHAMPTAEEAIGWVADGNIEYLLEKSDAEKIFDHEATKENIIRMAEDDLEDENYSIWEKIFEYIDGHYDENNNIFIYDEADLEDKETRNLARNCFLRDAYDEGEWDARAVYEYFSIDDYYGTFKYKEQAYWQIHALKKWAELMVKESDEQAA